MMATTTPGNRLAYKWITGECRRNHGDEGALEEAFAWLRQMYLATCKGYEDKDAIVFHVVLTVERIRGFDPSGKPEAVPEDRIP